MGKINPRVPGYRFHRNLRAGEKKEAVGWVSPTEEKKFFKRCKRIFTALKGDKKVFKMFLIIKNNWTTKNLCFDCGRPYESIKRTVVRNGKQICLHDSNAYYSPDKTKLTTAEQRRISDNLRPNEVALKSTDGTIGIYERNK